MLIKSSKDTLNINNVNTLNSLRAAKYNKYEIQSLQDLKETAVGLLKFQFKLGYVEEQLFVVAYISSYKNGSFIVDVKQTFTK